MIEIQIAAMPSGFYQFTADADSLKGRISEAVLKVLPGDFAVDSVEFAEEFEISGEGQEFEAEVTVRLGYLSKTVSVPVKVTESLIGTINFDIDGKITAIDANIIRKYVVKIITELPV